jgi:hypothetical protein
MIEAGNVWREHEYKVCGTSNSLPETFSSLASSVTPPTRRAPTTGRASSRSLKSSAGESHAGTDCG